MKNPQLTSRVVIGVGLVAVFGIGLAVAVESSKHQPRSQVAANVPPPAAASTADAFGPPAQVPADQTAAPSVAGPDAANRVAAGAPLETPNAPSDSVATPGNVTTPAESRKPDRSERYLASARTGDSNATTPEAAAASPKGNPSSETARTMPDNVAINSAVASSSSDTTAEPASGTMTETRAGTASTDQGTSITAGTTAPAVATGNDAAPDSQISAHVKSEIAAATPNSKVDVTTTNGVVALVGSVPNQDAANEARQAALRVAGVKFVDTSALMVSNQ